LKKDIIIAIESIICVLRKSYPENTFYSQAYFPFDDHEAPPINMLIPFCENLHEWLTQSKDNIAAIHCKAGKGRTGTLICCYLLYTGLLKSADDSLKYYGLMRTENGKGVTIPSQIRYVIYFERIMKQSIETPINPPIILISKIKLVTVPNFTLIGSGCSPYFDIVNENSSYNYKTKNKINSYKNEAYIEFKVNNFSVSGDVKISFYNKKTIGKDKIFKFWFNTYFVPNDGILTIKKSMLDKACKDKENKHFDQNFKVIIQFIILDEQFNALDINYFKDVEPFIGY